MDYLEVVANVIASHVQNAKRKTMQHQALELLLLESLANSIADEVDEKTWGFDKEAFLATCGVLVPTVN